MRLLFWSESFWPSIGGAEVLGARLVRALRGRGYEIVLITSRGTPAVPAEDDYAGIPIYRFPFRGMLRGGDLDGIVRTRRRTAEIQRAFEPDLVSVYLWGPVLHFQARAMAAHPAPVLANLHGASSTSLLRPDRPIGRWLRDADWVVACSAYVLARHRREAPEITPKSSVLYVGAPDVDGPAAPPAFDDPVILCLGRLVEQKGFDVALRAFRRVIGRFPRARLVIGGDGPLRSALERQASEEGVAASVEFVGWVHPDDVPSLIGTATVVVLPSRYEGLPVVALQAAQQVRPVVASGVDGLPEAVVDGETGLLVEPEDDEGLARAIEHLLEHPELATRMGEAGRRRASARFSWEAYVNGYDQLCRQLASGRTPVASPALD